MNWTLPQQLAAPLLLDHTVNTITDLGFENGDIAVNKDNQIEQYFIDSSGGMIMLTDDPLKDPLHGGNHFNRLRQNGTYLMKMASVAMSATMPAVDNINLKKFADWLFDIATRTSYNFLTSDEEATIKRMLEGDGNRDTTAMLQAILIRIAKRLPKLKGLPYINLQTETEILCVQDSLWTSDMFSGVITKKGVACSIPLGVGDVRFDSFDCKHFIPKELYHYERAQGRY